MILQNTPAPGGTRGIFSKYLENRPLFSKYLEKRPIHIFLIDTFQFFQITTIYRGTQVTTPRGGFGAYFQEAPPRLVTCVPL